MEMDQAHQQTEKRLHDLEQRIAEIYREASEELRETIEEYFQAFQARDDEMRALVASGEITKEHYLQWRLNQIGRGERFASLRDTMAERYTDANEVALSYINDATPGIYSLNRNYAAYTIEAVAGSVGFTLFDESTVRRLLREEPDLMPHYPEEKALKRGIDLRWGKKQITASVTSGILQGKSPGKIASDLQQRISDMNRASAVRAARTAVTGAQNAGRMDSYQAAHDMGIEMEKEWLSTLDGRTRHSHRRMDGETVGYDEKFSNGCRYPGDPRGKPEEVYNCRCTMIAKVKGAGIGDAQRRARDPETGKNVLIENMTYQEWEKSKREQQRSIEADAIALYNNTIQKHVKIDVTQVYHAAQNGTRNRGVYVDAVKKRQKNLEKSIASHTAQVEEHARKMQYPEEYDAGWDQKDERQRQGLLRKREKDLRRNAEQAEIEIEVWKERFGDEQ